jgi:hypothetical protein
MITTPHLAFRILSAISALCGIIILFLPVVWMEIGPEGIAYYGPDVPDIYIYGGVITGKDLSWMPILVAMLFQFAFILIGIFTSVANCLSMWIPWRAIVVTWFQTGLLILFPFWMTLYTSHVINNSDGAAADLTVHLGSGVTLYVLILATNISQLLLIHVGMRKRKARMLPA